MTQTVSGPRLPDVRLGAARPTNRTFAAGVSNGHEASAWTRAKAEKLGDGPTPPRRFSWETTP